MDAVSEHTVMLGETEVTFPSKELMQLDSCNHLLHDRQALLHELNTKGYLYIKELHNRDEVLNARLAVLHYIHNSGENKLNPNVKLEEGILHQRCGLGCIPFMEGANDITNEATVQRVLEGERPKQFFKKLFGEESKTFDYKWLRGVHRNSFTGVHVDNVYMSWGTPELYTMWTPFDDVTVEMGTLAVCEGSCSLSSFTRFQDTYGNFDVEKSNHQGSGWFTTDAFEITKKFGGQWKTTAFRAGDVMIFGMRTVHMSTANLTDKVRISCDTRWLRKSAKADPRYMGKKFDSGTKYGAYARSDVTTHEDNRPSTMEELKVTWGLA